MSIPSCDKVVSVIIRACNSKKLFLLQEAIESIYKNTYRPIEVVIVVQSENEDYIQNVKHVASLYQENDLTSSVVVNKTSKDERSKNLNLGLQQAKGRYISFLDEDDVMRPDFIEHLLEPLLRSTEFAWSYGNSALTLCSIDELNRVHIKESSLPFSSIKYSLEKLLEMNFIPINCYLIDRLRVDAEILRFDESYTQAEDYNFILRLAASCSPFQVSHVVSEYRLFEDLENTNLIMNTILGIPDKAKIKAWNYALWRIELLKKELYPQYKSGFISLKTRKYIFYRLPELKIFLQYKIPWLRRKMVYLAYFLHLMPKVE